MAVGFNTHAQQSLVVSNQAEFKIRFTIEANSYGDAVYLIDKILA